jgi:hypothetical protein
VAVAGRPNVPLREQAEKREEAPLVVLGPQRPPEEEKNDPVGGARAIEKPPASEPSTSAENSSGKGCWS